MQEKELAVVSTSDVRSAGSSDKQTLKSLKHEETLLKKIRQVDVSRDAAKMLLSSNKMASKTDSSVEGVRRMTYLKARAKIFRL